VIELSHPLIVELLEESGVFKDLLYIKLARASVRSYLDRFLASILMVKSVKLSFVSVFLLLTFGKVLALRCSWLFLVSIHRGKELIFGLTQGIRLVESHSLTKLGWFSLFNFLRSARSQPTRSTAS
jgi:hypothetical protein